MSKARTYKQQFMVFKLTYMNIDARNLFGPKFFTLLFQCNI